MIGKPCECGDGYAPCQIGEGGECIQCGAKEMTVHLQTIYLEGIEAAYTNFLRQTTYVDPEWVGPLGRMDRIKIVGQKYCKTPPPEAFAGPLTLVPEPENPHDPRAIVVRYRGRQVGHIARSDTERLHALWEVVDQTGLDPNVPKVVNGGEIYGLFLIDLPDPL